jgi:hypothetical protein
LGAGDLDDVPHRQGVPADIRLVADQEETEAAPAAVELRIIEFHPNAAAED